MSEEKGSGPKIPLFKSQKLAADGGRKKFKDLFLIFGTLLAIGIFLSWALGRVVWKSANPSEVFPVVFEGPGQGRRAAIGEWAFQLQSAESNKSTSKLNEWRPRGNLVDRLLRLFKESLQGQDVLFISSVATVLSYSQEHRAEIGQALSEALGNDASFSDPQLGVHLLLALARVGVPEGTAMPWLDRYAHSTDPSLRKATAFVLGTHSDAKDNASRQALYGLLHDPVEDVRWNAAFALAKIGDREALPVLRELLDHAEKIAQGTEVLTAELYAALSEAFSWLSRLNDAESMQRIRGMAKSHPNLKIRQLALEVVASKSS